MVGRYTMMMTMHRTSHGA